MLPVVFALVGIAVVVWLFAPPTPLKHRHLTSEQFDQLVRALHQRGMDDAELRLFDGKAEAPFLVIIKLIRGPNDIHLRVQASAEESTFSDINQAISFASIRVRDALASGGVWGTLHNVSERNVRIGWTD